jgi:hypothetical protein
MKMKIMVWMFILCLVFYSVGALGVARPFFTDNTAQMEANETMTINFQLQNMESVQKKMIFKISSQHTMEIDGSQDYENQFTLAAGEIRDVPIEFNTSDEGLYRIDYSYSEICPSTSGICLNTEVGDSFFIQVGDDGKYWAFDIPLDYDGYKLSTESRVISSVDDLVITTDDGLIEVDFSGRIIDLTGFLEQYVSFGPRKVTISGFAALNKLAIITMYQVESNYEIKKDGVSCPLSVCNVLSYSNKRLRFEVPGFSSYEAAYVSQSTTTPSSGGGSGGGININVTSSNTTPIMPVEKPVIQLEPQVNLSDRINKPSPFINTQVNNTQKIVQKTPVEAPEGKDLLIRSILLGAGALFVGGLLFFFIRKDA